MGTLFDEFKELDVFTDPDAPEIHAVLRNPAIVNIFEETLDALYGRGVVSDSVEDLSMATSTEEVAALIFEGLKEAYDSLGDCDVSSLPCTLQQQLRYLDAECIYNCIKEMHNKRIRMNLYSPTKLIQNFLFNNMGVYSPFECLGWRTVHDYFTFIENYLKKAGNTVLVADIRTCYFAKIRELYDFTRFSLPNSLLACYSQAMESLTGKALHQAVLEFRESFGDLCCCEPSLTHLLQCGTDKEAILRFIFLSSNTMSIYLQRFF